MNLDPVLSQALKRISGRKLASYRPYGHPDTLWPDGALWQLNGWPKWSNKPWQLDFHQAGKHNPDRMLMAANRVGKTECAGAEIAIHATGMYPNWWDGWYCDPAPLVWTGAMTNEASRDVVQACLLGGLGDRLGTGFLPRETIVGKPKMKQAGVSNVVDLVEIKRASGGADVSGGTSLVLFKTYDQGWQKWMGAAPNIVWLDEEPKSNEKDQSKIFSEAQTRVLSTKGILLVTFTPLQGETDLVRYFKYPKTTGVMLVIATWDDAPHLGREQMARLKAGYPEHEVDARTKGVPMLGEGRVFPVGEDEIKVEPFAIPPQFRRICGIDFGMNHPAAGVWIAHDAFRDILYIYDCYRKSDQTSDWHAQQIINRGGWIPVAWPHDGMNREPKSGKILASLYSSHGVSMLARSARYEHDKGGRQDTEPIVMDMLERMQDGRLKVFSTCTDWFEEFRFYHRKDGVIVPIRDDIMKATQYGIMMRRHARATAVRTRRKAPGVMLG